MSAIRTIDLQQKNNGRYQGCMGVGGGIVFDSQADAEYEECKLKAKFLMDARPDFALIETMLWDGKSIRHLNRHLSRLKASAKDFSIPFSSGKIKSLLKQYTQTLEGKARLRLLVKSAGDVVLEHSPVPLKSENPVIALSETRTFSGNPFLYHKSTHRSLYDEEYRRYSARGHFDVIFSNEKDQITEGAISNIFICKKNRWYTPMVNCGLLSGIKRQIMIRKLKASETVLYKKDLLQADKIMLTNSVRGATEVKLEG